MNCSLNFWSISNFRNFREDLPTYKAKIEQNDLDRIQIQEGSNLNEVLPVLKKEIYAQHRDMPLRFFLYQNFDIEWITSITEVKKLYIEAYYNIHNLDKLEAFKNLKMLVLECDFCTVPNLDFLTNLPEDLEVLALTTIGKSKKLDLSPIAHFKKLKFLYINGIEKNLDKVLPQFTQLEELRLRSVSKPKNMDCLAELKQLKNVTFQLCGFENIDVLSNLKSVRYLQLWRLPKLTNLDFISKMDGLQHLFIETLNGIEKFPNVADLQKLLRVIITSCKNITDFSEVAKSKSIKEFAIQNATQTDLTIFKPILQNIHIEHIGIGYEKVATQKEMFALAQQCGRERIAVYRYPDFAKFEFEE